MVFSLFLVETPHIIARCHSASQWQIANTVGDFAVNSPAYIIGDTFPAAEEAPSCNLREANRTARIPKFLRF